MAKLITIPSSMDEINKTKKIVDGFIIGIENMCVNSIFNIKELSLLEELSNKEIFILLNKNFHNSDINIIKNILVELNKYNITGVIYADVGVLNIYNSLNLNYDLVWANEHAVTNFNSINYWNKKGAKYAYLSSDITYDEIKVISSNTSSKLMLNVFGYLPMFVSKRHIVKNYLDYFSLNDNSSVNYMEKEDKIYPIIDNSIGTFCYSSNILNGIKYYVNLDVDYIVLNSFLIELEKFIEIIKIFKNVSVENVLEMDLKINSMFDNIDTGFLNRKTIYKVKKDEK